MQPAARHPSVVADTVVPRGPGVVETRVGAWITRPDFWKVLPPNKQLRFGDDELGFTFPILTSNCGILDE